MSKASFILAQSQVLDSLNLQQDLCCFHNFCEVFQKGIINYVTFFSHKAHRVNVVDPERNGEIDIFNFTTSLSILYCSTYILLIECHINIYYKYLYIYHNI